MKNCKTQRAITLIALIITIILLLILAGVTISLLTGENSILKYAKLSTEQYNIEQGKERIELILVEVDMKDIVSKTKTGLGDLADIIKNKDGIANTEIVDDNTIKVETEEGYEYEVTIDENGKTEIEHIGKTEGEEEEKEPEIAHVHVDECYSTACTGTFTKTATTQETWKTCTHTHTGSTTSGGGCYGSKTSKTCASPLLLGSQVTGNTTPIRCMSCRGVSVNEDHLGIYCSVGHVVSTSDLCFRCGVCGGYQSDTTFYRNYLYEYCNHLFSKLWQNSRNFKLDKRCRNMGM